jgi:hypothetical protein
MLVTLKKNLKDCHSDYVISVQVTKTKKQKRNETSNVKKAAENHKTLKIRKEKRV